MSSDNLIRTQKKKNVVVVGEGAVGMICTVQDTHVPIFTFYAPLTDNSPAPQLARALKSSSFLSHSII
jgi:hypothetical protein